MTRWLRIAGGAIYGTPILLVVLVLIVGLWVGAAEVYEYAVTVRSLGRGGSVVFGLVGLNAVVSGLLVFNLLGVTHDLRELRLPKDRQVLAGALSVILGFIVVAPCAFVWAVNGGAHDVLMVAVGSVVGTAGALLSRLRFRTRNARAVRRIAAAVTPTVPAKRPNPWRAVRVALGPPYAPASWQRRAIELVALCASLAGAPSLVLLCKSSLSTEGFRILLHASEFVGFLPAIALCWIWPLSRLIAVFKPHSGALTELALLPGLGDGRQQLRRLFLVALSVPAGGMVALLVLALRIVALEHLPNVAYTKLALEFTLIPLITIPVVLSHVAKPRAPTALAVTLFLISQTWTYTWLVWFVPWDMEHRLPVTFRWLALAGVLIALMVPIGLVIHWLRSLLQRPNPFVEVSS
jgi:hypothetical protein